MCRFGIIGPGCARWQTVGVRVHLDTDLGTDPDDVCALAMLLGWPGVEVVGITTSTDRRGQRAAYAQYCLDLLGRSDIPVVAGAAMSLAHGERADPVVDDRRYWPDPVAPTPAPDDAATTLLVDSVERGAVIVAVGPYTNLAVLERERPGTLATARVVVMGGWVRPPAAGLPGWGPERDFNVQWDTAAARVVADSTADLTLSTLPVSLQAPLRRRDVGRLRRRGPMGALLAQQSEAHSADSGKAALVPEHPCLPDDLLNFHYDPLACAVALGWPGVTVEQMRLRVVMDGRVLHWREDAGGRRVRVVTDVDGEAFTKTWLAAVERACAGAL
jgi:purine nucleosidase